MQNSFYSQEQYNQTIKLLKDLNILYNLNLSDQEIENIIIYCSRDILSKDIKEYILSVIKAIDICT